MRMGLSYPALQPRRLDCPSVYQSAFSIADTPQLLLGSAIDGLVAVDPSTLAVQWSVRDLNVYGIAPLSTQGIVIVATSTGLHIFRLSDGASIGRVSADTTLCIRSR